MFTAYVHKLRLFSRNARLMLVLSAFIGIGYSGIFVLLFNLYLLRLGYGPEFIGLLNGVGPLANALFSLPAAEMGRRWGLRRAMILSTIAIPVGLLLVSLAEFIPPEIRTKWLLVWYTFAWLGATLYLVNFRPLLMAATHPEERNHVFSVTAAVTPLIAMSGSLLGGLLPGLFATLLHTPLDQAAAYRYPLLLGVLLLCFNLPAALATDEVVTAPQEKSAANPAGQASPPARPEVMQLILVLAVVILLRSAGAAAISAFFNVYMDASLRAPTAFIGALAAAAQLLSVPAILAMPILVARWGHDRIFILGTLGMMLGIMPLALISHWGGASLGYLCFIPFINLTATALNVYQMELVPSDHWATMSGFTNMAAGLSIAAFGLSGGYMIKLLGYQSLFLTAIGLTALGLLIFWVYFRMPRGELARRPAWQKA